MRCSVERQRAMFSRHHIDRIKTNLSEFSLDSVSITTNSHLPALYSYLEFYGFLHTLKGMPVEYYSGYRRPKGSASRWGRISTHFWRHANAKGTAILVHGLFDHVGLFQPLIRKILQENLSVVAIDLPGHGLSDGEPTVIEDFSNYAAVIDDTRAFFRDKVEGPMVGIGQSTGCAALMSNVFIAKQDGDPPPYDRLVLSAPLVRPCAWWYVNIAYVLLSPFLTTTTRRFTENTHDEGFNYFLSCSDVLQARALSVRWVGALRQWVKEFSSQPEIEIPSLVIQGTADKVVDWRWNIAQIQMHFKNLEQVYIEGGMHHLPNEPRPWSDAFDEALLGFLRTV